MKIPTPTNSTVSMITLAVCFVICLLGSVIIGLKIEFPEAQIAIPMPILVPLVIWSGCIVAYLCSIDSAIRWVCRQSITKADGTGP